MNTRLEKPYQFVTSIYVALIFSFYLLFFDNNGLTAILKAKTVCYYTLTISYIAAVVFLLALHVIQRKLRWQQFRFCLKNTPVAAWLILIYLLFTIISAVLSDYDAVWLGSIRREGVLTISLYCISFLLISRFFRPARWQLYLFAVAAAVFCGVCILQMLNINIFGLYPVSAEKSSNEDYIRSFIGTIGNIDFTASFFCIAVPIFWCSVLRLEGNRRFLLLIPLLLCLAVLVKINVAAGYVGVFVGALLSLPAVLPCGKKTRKLALIVVAAVFIVSGVIIYFQKFNQTELRQLHNILHGTIKDNYGSSRVYIWRRTLRAVPRHLWFGTGPDTMIHAAFARREILDANGAVLYIKSYDAAHNEYLTILYHQGVFALLSYLSALGLTLVQWVKQAKENSIAAVTGAAVLCYCLQAFFGISQLITSPFFWCVFAISVKALGVKKETLKN